MSTPHVHMPEELPEWVRNEGDDANPNSDAAGWCMDPDHTTASPCYPLADYPYPLSDDDYAFSTPDNGQCVVCPNPDGPG